MVVELGDDRSGLLVCGMAHVEKVYPGHDGYCADCGDDLFEECIHCNEEGRSVPIRVDVTPEGVKLPSYCHECERSHLWAKPGPPGL